MTMMINSAAVRGFMTADFVAVEVNAGVRSAMRRLIERAGECGNIAAVYVVDGGGVLLGRIELARLIRARDGEELSSLLERDFPAAHVDEDITDCALRLAGTPGESVPVLDGAGRLAGVLTCAELARLAGEAAGEDYARLSGLGGEEDLDEPLRSSVRKRLPWLVALLGLGLLVSGVVGAFERVAARLTLLVSFQSLVLDMAGNVGTQSLAVTIRVLTDRGLSRRRRLRLLAKETRVGLANGLALGLISVLCIGLYLIAFRGQSAAAAFSVSLCTSAALIVSVAASGAAGTVIPLIFDRLHIDPAVASGPLITTVNDLIAVVAYYGLAWLLLINTLGM